MWFTFFFTLAGTARIKHSRVRAAANTANYPFAI